MPVSTNAAIQTDYLSATDYPKPGSRWRGSHGGVQEKIDTACGDLRPLVLGVFEITATAATNGEAWQINYDGVLIPFTTTAAVNSTATAIHTALQTVFGAGKALEEDVMSGGVTVDADTVTIEFADGRSHTIALVPPGGALSTFDADWTEDGTPSAPVDHVPGLWVDLDTSGFDPQLVRIKQPDSASDTPYGIVSAEGAVAVAVDAFTPADTIGPRWPAGQAMSVARAGQFFGIADGEVPITSIGKPVFRVHTGTAKGRSRINDGGSVQVTTGTVVANNGDTVGLTIDSLPTVNVTSTASASGTATLLANALNDQADVAAVLTATTDGASIILTFKDKTTHTVVANSPATADVNPISSVAAVAATAKQTNSQFMTPAGDGESVAIQIREA